VTKRTPEQIAADNDLTDAIERVRLAYADPTDPSFLMTDYMVLFAAQRFDENGEGWTMVGHVYRDSDVPAYRLLGLVDFAQIRLRRLIAEDED
jgi:hypothetical protein